MTRRDDLEAALRDPNESLTFEYKRWLDLGSNHGKATLAKAVIAMANAEGGFVVIGYEEEGDTLRSVPCPDGIPEITQDLANGAVQRYADPAIHVRVDWVKNGETGVRHPVVIVPADTGTPAMAKRDCEGVLNQARIYVRKPGPRSEEPRTVEEWRDLLDRYVRRGRSNMLDAIRAIVEGRAEEADAQPDLQERLAAFMAASAERHEALIDGASLPPTEPARMPMGRYEIGFAFDGADEVPSLTSLRSRIDEAHRVKLTGWPAFLTMIRPEFGPFPSDGGIEAWLGRPVGEHFREDAAHANFWRIAPEGLLYMASGYNEDSSTDRVEPGTAFDLTLPVWRVGEAVLFARRLAATFEGVERIAARVRWSGLEGRALRTLTGTRGSMSYDRVSRTGEVTSQIVTTPDQIDDTLPEVLRSLLAPVYEIFDFYDLPVRIVEEELANLRRRIG